MGNFIDLAAVLDPVDRVRSTLVALGSEASCYSVRPDRTLVFYEEATGDIRRVQELSRCLGSAAFACHIHDDDLWLYEFYLAGELADKFNTLPNYWKKLKPSELAEWKGDADLLARRWSGLEADSVRAYLCNQDSFLDGPSCKAYPNDEYAYGDCWQLTDFLRKLGTPYPDSDQLTSRE